MRNEEWKHDELILVLIMKDVPGTHIYLNLHFFPGTTAVHCLCKQQYVGS